MLDMAEVVDEGRAEVVDEGRAEVVSVPVPVAVRASSVHVRGRLCCLSLGLGLVETI